ncbi:DNA-binding NarL/FixJ family response regulator [Balneicella halophila]|uniref:DNA-binding NarL/FixJ family response regulator n=1 Tax=Balneicella halophila TaxID=1537566 RepID=A0A7L4URH6_BALHA|nr:LuxR C-terminal-related transcriptional regulator [Balneicella halophila]PVX52366.1 DNA-binding NarL/FixJ family response regulator [Balneicella halophila]
MYSKIVVIEPSFILRKGIIHLLNENFPEIKIDEKTNHSVVSLISSEDNNDVLYLISIRIYVRNKQLLERWKDRMVFLTYKNMDIPYINYLKTSEEEFVSTINLALGIQSNESKDDDEILTESERNVLRQIALGRSNKEIAKQLFVSIHTVTTHRKNITRKLDIKSVSGLTVYAILHKLVAMDEIQS